MEKLEETLDVIENSDKEWVSFAQLEGEIDVDSSTLAAIMRELEDSHGVERETIGYRMCGYRIRNS